MSNIASLIQLSFTIWYAFNFIVPKNEEKAYGRGKATSLFKKI
jgi:hypothetical protein